MTVYGITWTYPNGEVENDPDIVLLNWGEAWVFTSHYNEDGEGEEENIYCSWFTYQIPMAAYCRLWLRRKFNMWRAVGTKYMVGRSMRALRAKS